MSRDAEPLLPGISRGMVRGRTGWKTKSPGRVFPDHLVQIPVTPGNGRIESDFVNASPGSAWPPAPTPKIGVVLRPWRRLAARVAAGGLAVVVIGAAVVGAVLFDTDAGIWIDTPWLVPELLPGVIAFSAAGAVLILIRPARIVGWLLMASAVLYAVSILSAGVWYASLGEPWTFTTWLFNASFASQSIAVWFAYLLLPQLFPDGVLKGWLWRTLLAVSILLLVAQLTLLALGPLWVNYYQSMVVEPLEPVNREWAMRVIPRLGVLLTVIAVVALLERLRRGPRQRRRQMAGLVAVYLTTEAVWYLTWFTVDPDSKIVPPVSAIIFPPAVVVAIAFAMLRYGLYDVRPLHRAVVYALLAVGLTAAFAAAYLVVLSGVSLQLAGGPYSWLIVVTTLVVVLVAEPVRRRLRHRLERRFLGERGEPLRVLGRLDQMVTSSRSDEPTVYATIAETVMEAVRSSGAGVLLYRAGALEPVGSAGVVGDEPLVLPLVHRGERLGELRVAARTPGEAYGRPDRELLDQIAGQTAAISYGLRRDRDIDQLRTMALEGMAEQRMQLGRDLHDGLAPLLAGAGLTAEALRRGMSDGSADADEAARLAARLRTAATEVRQIAHDLQPTGTGTAGLTGVIRDHVASLTGPDLPSFTVDLDDLDDQTLPATVELEVSRVALEAVTNVVRHAHARHAHVSVKIMDGPLELVVSDDGVGIGQPYLAGLGITSMRARVEALGGAFTMIPATGGGTCLTVRIPVPVTT